MIRGMNSFQTIIIGFLMVILIGSVLLTLPISSYNGEFTPFIDALFTATSATCVTGLIVYDTATYWSVFGQVIILLLIQIGGMGIVTIGVAVATISGRKIGLGQRNTMKDAISAPDVGGIVKFTKFFCKWIFIIEAIGALCMFPIFYMDFGLVKGIWYSVFHSISAFCNAGFDLLGNVERFSSLTSYVGHPIINIVIMSLIIIGGLGFLTWSDIKTHKFHIKKYRLQSKIIMVTTIGLLVVPAVFFYFVEFSRTVWSDLSNSDKIFASMFQSVTPRTAGFNTVDLTLLGEASQTIMIVLMLIGGSPGSTAGGMKTTTFAVIIITLLAVFKRRGNVSCMRRRIDIDAIKIAASISFMYIALFVISGIAISCIEGISMITSLYETASAIGTVGVTLGVTSGLQGISKVILILLMYLGRVGGLTIAYAAISGYRENTSMLPREKVTVG